MSPLNIIISVLSLLILLPKCSNSLIPSNFVGNRFIRLREHRSFSLSMIRENEKDSKNNESISPSQQNNKDFFDERGDFRAPKINGERRVPFPSFSYAKFPQQSRNTNSIPFDPETSLTKSRLLLKRSYARKEAFAAVNATRAPCLDDLAPPPSIEYERFWISFPFRVAIPVIAYFSFPYVTEFFGEFFTMSSENLNRIASTYTPGISLLYATFMSITLSILYNRQSSVQERSSVESALLSQLARNTLSLFHDDQKSAVDACQCVIDQVETLVRKSRGQELMGIIYSDPYAKISEIVTNRELVPSKENNNPGARGALVSQIRDCLSELNVLRAQRLSDEALVLPPTHFFVLFSLTSLLLFGFVVTSISTTGPNEAPSNESSLLFSALCSIYVLFYSFARDLNTPFEGVYQIRRSSTACHLLQAKWLIANHPLVGGKVEFSDMEEGENEDVLIETPGLGTMTLTKNDFIPFQ